MLYYIIMCIVPAVQVSFVGCLERDNLENEDLENPAFFYQFLFATTLKFLISKFWTTRVDIDEWNDDFLLL